MTDTPSPEEGQQGQEWPAGPPLEPVPESDTMRELRERTRALNARSRQGCYY